MKLKKGDTVKVLKGKDKGKTSTVERVFPREESLVVNGVNQYKRHFKSKTRGQKSEIITITKPLPVSSVALICNKCKKTTRVGFVVKEGKKERICKKCEEVI